jgi:iron complex transport system substrate-binding protein
LAAGAVASEPVTQPDQIMKRRQQGILTGMPFMANLAPRTFVDDLGRKIYLAKPPTRLVSLAPSITEMLYAIGLGDRLVGVTQFCDSPPEAQTKPKVAYAQPNLESIVALQPDLVLAPREFIRADVLSKLEQLKIAAFIFDAKIIEDIPSHIQTLGRMLDGSASANQVAMDLRRRLAELKSRTEHLPRPRVLYVLNSQPLITVGPGSFVHHMIELAGGANVAARAKAPYPRLNMEEVIKEDPELIVFPVGSVEGIPQGEQELWRRWSTVSAVRHGRFHHVPSDLMNRPGPRIAQGLERLARILHPEAFQGTLHPDGNPQ